MLESLGLIRRKVEVFIHGLANRVMFMKDNSREEKEMEEVLSGGQMAVGMKVTLEMECSLVGEFFIEREVIVSMKATGTMVCLMARVLSISRTVRDTRALSKKTSSTARAYFTKTTL